MRTCVKISLALCCCLAGCHFTPLYGEHTTEGVCVLPIPEASGLSMYNQLKQHFPETNSCQYTLKVDAPKTSLSAQTISDKDFVTMQQVNSSVSYSLLDQNKKVVLKNQLSTMGSSAVTDNPYAIVVAVDKTEANLNAVLAEQIALHVAAFLDKDQK